MASHGIGPRYTVLQKTRHAQKAKPPTRPTTSELQNRRPISDHIIRAGPMNASGQMPGCGKQQR